METELPAIKTMLRQFWERYRFIDGLDIAEPEKTLPFYLHGDEGRGQVRRPVMVISFQPVLSACGSEHLNSGKTLVLFFRINLSYVCQPFWFSPMFSGLQLCAEQH